MRIKLTDADYQAGLNRFGFIKWSDVKAEARRKAAERLLEENAKRQKEVCDSLVGCAGCATHSKWLKLQDEFDRLMSEHDELLDIAFPQSAKGGDQ